MAIQVSKMIINNKYNVFKILDINDMVPLEKYINMYSTVAKDINKNFITKLAKYDYKISKIYYIQEYNSNIKILLSYNTSSFNELLAAFVPVPIKSE